MALYPSNKPYISSRNEGQLPRKRGRASFVDRIRLMHEQQLERSTVINQELSAFTAEMPSSTFMSTYGVPHGVEIGDLKQYLQTRPELKFDYGLRLRMNAGENIMYDVRPEL